MLFPLAGGLCLLLALAGCHVTAPIPDQATVAGHLADRFGPALASQAGPGVAPDAPLTEDAALALALWNNALFQEQLVDLGIARADLVQAGLLPNPEFVYYWPMGLKPYKYLFDFPIESLWLMPIRVKAAERDAERTAARLSQIGLDLIRDVRQAYADVLVAKERERVAGEAVKLRRRIADLVEKRLRAGDVSPQEAATAKIDVLLAEQDATRIGYDVSVAEERLRHLLGVTLPCGPLKLDAAPMPPTLTFDADALAHEAADQRPDAAAAAEAVAAAEARVKFAKVGWVRLLGIADATSGTGSHVLGPAVRATFPLFNHGEGAIARAEAELERAVRNRQTVTNQIVLDVRRAYLLYRQASAELEVLRTRVRPEVEAAIRRAEGAYQEGNVTYTIVLETTRQLLDNYLREAVLQGDLRRTWAELERSVGRRLNPECAPPPRLVADPAPAPDERNAP
jgi:cobalt-zinc-cadmium efflux system outer membrane protein